LHACFLEQAAAAPGTTGSHSYIGKQTRAI
ncbi:unnamed protein product, partial [marine sediment metagenome]